MSSAYEAAKPTTALDLSSLPQAILVAVQDYFAANGVDLPGHQYVTAGDPNQVAWDCEQLVVCLADLGWGRATDATQLSPSFGKTASVNAMRHATYAVILTRCVPTIADGGDVPGVDELTRSGLATMTDAGLLSQCLVNFVAFHNAAMSIGANVQAGAVQMIGPSGGLVGCTGALISTAGELLPAGDLPGHLAVRNGSPGGGL